MLYMSHCIHLRAVLWSIGKLCSRVFLWGKRGGVQESLNNHGWIVVAFWNSQCLGGYLLDSDISRNQERAPVFPQGLWKNSSPCLLTPNRVEGEQFEEVIEGALCVGGSLTLPRGSPCCTMPWRNVLVPWREKERAPHLPLTLARVGCNPMSSLRPGRRHHWWVSLMPCRVTSWCSARPLRLCLVCLISEGFSACLHPFPSPLPLFWSKGQARDEDHFALKRTSSAEINLGSLCRIWSGRNPGLEVGWG